MAKHCEKEADAPGEAGAPTAGTATGTATALPDGILHLCEYEYGNDLLTEFARLQVTPAMRTGMLVGGCALAVAGVAAVASGNPFGWLGVFAIGIGLFLIWYRGQMFHVLAKRYIEAMERGEGQLTGRWRRVSATNEGLMVFSSDGRSRYYPFDKLTRLRHSDLMIVAEFGEEGVAVPVSSFVHGNAEDFAQLLNEKRRGR